MIRKGIISAILLFFVMQAQAGIMIVGNLTHEKVCTAGEVYEGELVIRNTGKTEEEVRIYQTDYRYFFDGTSEYGEPGRLYRSNASWIEYSPQRFRLPPGEEVVVQYRITVPEYSLEGTYWSILMVESVPQLEAKTIETQGVGITTVMRYGIQMISNLGQTGDRNIRFVNTRVLREADKRFLEVDIENTGSRLARPLVWAELFRQDGTSAGIFEGLAYRVYPGTSVRHRIELTNIAEGDYKALVVADCGEDDLFGINTTVNVGK